MSRGIVCMTAGEYLPPVYWMYSHAPSLCFDAIVSLANRTTVVGDVACTLSEFATAWVTTPSDYDTLFAATVRSDWARLHRPVLSRGRTDHVLYTGFHVTEPLGQVVRCHQGCGVENRSYSVKGQRASITCRQCGSTCTIDFGGARSDPSTALGSRSLVKVDYPQPLLPVQWLLGTPKPPASTVIQTLVNNPATSLSSPSFTPAHVGPGPPVPSPTIGSRPTFLVPPPHPLSHSVSLPTLSPRSSVRPLQPAALATRPGSSSSRPKAPPHISTTASTAASRPEVLPPPPLTIRISRPPRRLEPPPQIARSQSSPQMGERQEVSRSLQQPAKRRKLNDPKGKARL
jgi:hypothetical protein